VLSLSQILHPAVGVFAGLITLKVELVLAVLAQKLIRVFLRWTFLVAFLVDVFSTSCEIVNAEDFLFFTTFLLFCDCMAPLAGN
jgi:hypothetical protein